MSSATNDLLPQQFAGLARHLNFALPTTKERVRARVNSNMPELQAFYDDIGPQMDNIMTYLLDFPPDEKQLDPPVLRLVKLAKAFMAIAPALELFHAHMDDRVVTPYRAQSAAA